MDKRDQCGHCALGKDCFSESLDVSAFKDMVSGHHHYDAGQVLFSEGAQSKFAAVVQSGAIKRTRGDMIIGLALPGDYLGLSCLYSTTQVETAIALERSRVCRLDTQTELPNHPQAVRLMAREMEQQRWQLEIQLKPATARLASWLLRLSAHQCGRGLSRTHIRLPLNRTDTANYLGLALETTSRLISKLNKDGLIKVQGREIELLDLPGLAQLEIQGQTEQLGQ